MELRGSVTSIMFLCVATTLWSGVAVSTVRRFLGASLNPPLGKGAKFLVLSLLSVLNSCRYPRVPVCLRHCLGVFLLCSRSTQPGSRILYLVNCWWICSMRVYGKRTLMGRTFFFPLTVSCRVGQGHMSLPLFFLTFSPLLTRQFCWRMFLVSRSIASAISRRVLEVLVPLSRKVSQFRSQAGTHFLENLERDLKFAG